MSTRNRVPQSSSLREVGLCTALHPVEPPPAHFSKNRPAAIAASKPGQKPAGGSKKPPAQPRQLCRSILSIGSPLREPTNEDSDNRVDERFGAFLETCFLCKKKITQKDDVFMCGYLRAFCSLTCRNIQICVDDNNVKSSPKSAEITRAENFLKNGLAKQANGHKVT